MSKLADFVDIDNLPEEYGGKAPPFSNEVGALYKKT
jgi:hypothetical protein